MDKWLILRSWQERHKMSLEHLIMPERKRILKEGRKKEGTRKRKKGKKKVCNAKRVLEPAEGAPMAKDERVRAAKCSAQL